MKVDLIIPVYKPDDKFDKLLKEIKNQTVQPNHIYIMNTEEKYFHSENISLFSNITISHISKQDFDHGGTRNAGARQSDETVELLLFMTQDAVPADEYMIANLVKAFSDDEVAAAYARQLADRKVNPMEYYTRLFNYPKESQKKSMKDYERLGIKTFFCSNVCAMYRKEEYIKAGEFPLETIFNEDMIMAMRLVQRGKTIAYQADAKVWHWHDYTALEQFHRNFDVAVSQMQAGDLLKETKSESEGIRLVKSTCVSLLKEGRFWWVCKVIWYSGFKFLGYKLGQRYDRLPRKLVRKFALNPEYFDKLQK